MDVDNLANHLRKRTDVAFVTSYVNILKMLNKAWHDNNPDWEKLPNDENTIGEFIFHVNTSLEPEVSRPYFDMDNRYANIQVILRNHRSKTIKDIIQDIQAFLSKNQRSNVNFLQAAGTIGILAGIIEEIEKRHMSSIYMISLACFIFSALIFQSFTAGLITLIPLVLGIIITFAVMGFGKIGLFLYTLPVASVGTGLGVDYYLYVIARIKEEIQAGKEANAALSAALTTAGKAVLFTGLAIIFGVSILIISDLRFQTIMGAMLAVIIMCNMLGALILLPVIITLWKPKFIYQKS